MPPEFVQCANEDHMPRPASFRVTFPTGRYRPTTACPTCARRLVSEAVVGRYSIYLEAVNDT